jgi:GNAT superfamily N-acetyltransferase
MTWDEFDAWSPHSVRGHAAQQVAAGLRPEAEALADAQQQLEAQLPDGIASHLQLLHTVRAESPDGPVVGHLWLRLRPRADEVEAYLMDVEVDAGLRGRGHGRAAVLAAERLARDLGATVLRLNVFGHNAVAIALYRDLGLVVTGATLTAPLPRPGGPDGGLQVRPAGDLEVSQVRARLAQERAGDLTRSSGLASAQALRRAEDEVRRALAHRSVTTEQLLLAAYDGDTAVGTLWLELERLSDGLHVVLRDLWTPPGPQRRTTVPAVLVAALGTATDLGATCLRLTWPDVDRTSAREVYDDLGFAVTAQTMEKPLAGSPARR